MNRLKKISFLLLILNPLDLIAQHSIKINRLEDAINYSLQNNRKILVSRQIASNTLDFARKDIGAFLPKINFSFNDSAIVNQNASDYRNKNLSIGFSWLLYDGGQQKNEHKLNILEALFAKLSNEKQIDEHCIQVMEAYFECQKGLKKREVLLQTIEHSNRWKTTLEKELHLGLIVETDFLDYEIKCLELERQLVDVETDIFCQNYNLKNLLGLHFEDELTVLPDEAIKENAAESNEDFESILYKSLCNSLDYKKLKVEVEYSSKLKELEKAFYLPNISLQPGISFQGEDYPLHGPKWQMMVSFSFDRNPFLSFQGSQNLSRKNKSLDESTTYGQAASKNQFAWKSQKKLDRLNFCSQVISISDFEENLKLSIWNLLEQRKQLKLSLEIQKKEVLLDEKLNAIFEKEVEQGQKKALDLLEHKIESMQKRLALYEGEIQLVIINKTIENLSSSISGENRYAN